MNFEIQKRYRVEKYLKFVYLQTFITLYLEKLHYLNYPKTILGKEK